MLLEKISFKYTTCIVCYYVYESQEYKLGVAIYLLIILLYYSLFLFIKNGIAESINLLLKSFN